MSNTQNTSTTLEKATPDLALSELDLKELPTIYILPVHLPLAQLHDVEDQLASLGATVTYNILEARLILGAVTTARRAKFELQCRKFRTEEIISLETCLATGSLNPHEDNKRPSKRQRLTDLDVDGAVVEFSSIGSENQDDRSSTIEPVSQLSISRDTTAYTVHLSEHSSDHIENDFILPSFVSVTGEEIIRVVKLDWLKDSVEKGHLFRLESYVIYEGKVLSDVGTAVIAETTKPAPPKSFSSVRGETTTDDEPHASENAVQGSSSGVTDDRLQGGKRSHREVEDQSQSQNHNYSIPSQRGKQSHRGLTTRPVQLLRQTTSEHDEGTSGRLPEMPNWVKENKIYSCERATLLKTPNEAFVKQLEKIKLARILTLDEIGVRAYSTSIASIAAYPYELSSTSEVMALPGCDHKIAQLFHEWKHSEGRIQTVEDIDTDPVLTVLKTFYNIHGVGAATAREFYFDDNKQWRELDDVIEYGWNTLSRVQQIGLKFYDDLNLKISRSEAEFIASVVTYHAKQIVDDGIECIIVGGYRRGKTEVGDVDIMLTHREKAATHGLIKPLTDNLENSGWITHCLSLHETNTHRDQQTLPYISGQRRGGGFDTLDKALLVWQDPNWPTKQADLAANPKAKNPNVHRRVDIIISPWRTIGCAVEGWSSDTTFQRDLRRYAKHIKGWKFDSSGVRERGTGKWIDLERWVDEKTRAKTWEEAERRVFEGLGLEYLEPWERCTG